MKAPGKTSPSRGGSGGSEQAGGLDDETADGILGSTLAGMVCLGRTGQHDEGSVNSGACVEATGKPAMNGRARTGPVGATEGGGLRGARLSSPVDAEISWQIKVHQNRFSSLAEAGARYEAHSSFAEAMEFVKQVTAIRASERAC